MRLFRSRFLIFFVILSFVVYNFYPLDAFARREKIKVGFIGFRFEGVGKKAEKDVTNSVLYLLAQKPFVEIVSPDEAVLLVGRDNVNKVLSNPSENEIIVLLHMLGVDYLFFGNFTNQVSDTVNYVLSGSIECFDRPKKRFHTYETVLTPSNIEREVKKMDGEFVNEILPTRASAFTSWFFIIVLGLLVLGTYTLVWGLSSGEVQDTGSSPVTQ